MVGVQGGIQGWYIPGWAYREVYTRLYTPREASRERGLYQAIHPGKLAGRLYPGYTPPRLAGRLYPGYTPPGCTSA